MLTKREKNLHFFLEILIHLIFIIIRQLWFQLCHRLSHLCNWIDSTRDMLNYYVDFAFRNPLARPIITNDCNAAFTPLVACAHHIKWRPKCADYVVFLTASSINKYRRSKKSTQIRLSTWFIARMHLTTELIQQQSIVYWAWLYKYNTFKTFQDASV